MKANEFVKKFGVHIADHCLNDCASPDDRWFIHHGALIDGEDFDDLKRLVEAHELVNECGGLDSCVKKLAVREKFKPKAEYFAIHHEKPHLIQMYARSEPKLTPNYSFKKLIQAIKLVESCQ